MIEANVEILAQRVERAQVANGVIKELLNTFVRTRKTLDVDWPDAGMTAGQKQGGLSKLTALAADLQARRDSVDEAFTATNPLPPDPA